MSFSKLRTFRQELYDNVRHSKAALFDLMDALLTTNKAPSLVQVSLSPLFRRQWSSLFKAIEQFRLSSNTLMSWLMNFLVVTNELVIIVLDHTSWSRLWSPTLKERTFEHQPNVIAGNKPVTVGQGYSTVAVIPEDQGSWVLPLRHERITSFESPLSRGIFQLKQVCRHLLKRTQRVLVVADSEYANAPFLAGTRGLLLDKLLRVRPNRVLWGAPLAIVGEDVLGCTASALPSRSIETGMRRPTRNNVSLTRSLIDEKLGRVRLRLWSQLHFKQAPQDGFELVCVEYLDKSQAQPLWLLWQGQTSLTLE